MSSTAVSHAHTSAQLSAPLQSQTASVAQGNISAVIQNPASTSSQSAAQSQLPTPNSRSCRPAEWIQVLRAVCSAHQWKMIYTMITLAMTTAAFATGIYMIVLAKWTALNDYLQSCTALRQLGQPLGQSCIDAIAAGAVYPPLGRPAREPVLDRPPALNQTSLLDLNITLSFCCASPERTHQTSPLDLNTTLSSCCASPGSYYYLESESSMKWATACIVLSCFCGLVVTAMLSMDEWVPQILTSKSSSGRQMMGEWRRGSLAIARVFGLPLDLLAACLLARAIELAAKSVVLVFSVVITAGNCLSAPGSDIVQ